jgi:beta-phosphoglucomutase-like phosphatase (HAD superfamily)
VRHPVAAVVLDMDGLMVDTEPIYKRAWQSAAKACGYPFDDTFYLTLIGKPTPASEAALVQHFGGAFPLADFRARWSELWLSEVNSCGIPAKPGLPELLSFLAHEQLPVAVATSSAREYAEISLRAAGLDMRFEHVVTGDQVDRGKPSPDIFLESARRLGVDARGCVALEDSDAGVLAASAAGMTTIMVPDLKAPSAEARSAAFSVVASLFDARTRIAALLSATPGAHALD